MKEKYKPLYMLLAIGGICLFAASALPFPEQIGAMLCGSGSGIAAAGFSCLLQLRHARKNPEQARKNEIADKDERNIAIRRRAKAASGEVLQWGIMAAAWFSIGLGAPLWVTLAAVGAFLAKSFLELWLMVRYEREM